MVRYYLARVALLAVSIGIVGCNSFRNNNSCCGDERPGLFSRFRLASRSTPIMMAPDHCMAGPYLPVAPSPATTLPPPNQNIPRIDENGKQMPWDGKTSRPSGTKTGNELKTIKEGT